MNQSTRGWGQSRGTHSSRRGRAKSVRQSRLPGVLLASLVLALLGATVMWSAVSTAQGASGRSTDPDPDPTQTQTRPIAARDSLEWTECLMPLRLDPAHAHHDNYQVACDAAAAFMHAQISEESLKAKYTLSAEKTSLFVQ